MTSLVDPQAHIDVHSHAVLLRGKQRDIYFLSAAEGLATDDGTPVVLKVPRYAERQRRQVWYKRILRSFFPSSTHRIITKEADYWQRLSLSAQKKGTMPPIPEFVGYVTTTAGRGAVWEAICDPDGTLAPTVADMAARQELHAQIAPLNRFVQRCFDEHIVAPDVHLGNLACTWKNGDRELVLIDGFGDHRMISVRALWPAYNRRSLIRSFERIASKFDVHFDLETRQFSLAEDVGAQPKASA
ncbi:MAG: YrbL family protein [Roseobacter sp.]